MWKTPRATWNGVLQQFQTNLEGILIGNHLLEKTCSLIRKNRTEPCRKVVPGVQPEVKINNQDSDFYTIVEVVGEDRLGILYELTRH